MTKLIERKYSLVLDSTFASPKALQNVKRLLDNNYRVELYYVYQDPHISWKYAQERVRIISRDKFKESTQNAFYNVVKAFKEFENDKNFTLVLQNQKIYTSKICNCEKDLIEAEKMLKINWSEI